MDRVRANTQSVQNQFVHCLVQVRTSSMLGVGAQLVNDLLTRDGAVVTVKNPKLHAALSGFTRRCFICHHGGSKLGIPLPQKFRSTLLQKPEIASVWTRLPKDECHWLWKHFTLSKHCREFGIKDGATFHVICVFS